MTSLLALMRPNAAPDAGMENDGTESGHEGANDLLVMPEWYAVLLEGEIASVLDAQPMPGEQLAAAFQRKELTLAALFARLTIADARELHRRFSRAFAGDGLAARFERLIAERRARLLAFLGGARRREAVQHARPCFRRQHG